VEGNFYEILLQKKNLYDSMKSSKTAWNNSRDSPQYSYENPVNYRYPVVIQQSEEFE